MRWVPPSAKDTAMATLEKRLWDAADQFRASSLLKVQAFVGFIPGIN
jgi:type I restriction enzyme M protein